MYIKYIHVHYIYIFIYYIYMYKLLYSVRKWLNSYHKTKEARRGSYIYDIYIPTTTEFRSDALTD